MEPLLMSSEHSTNKYSIESIKSDFDKNLIYRKRVSKYLKIKPLTKFTHR